MYKPKFMETALEIERPVVKTLTVEFYKSNFKNVAHFISKMGGTFEDAKDILHDALIIYQEKIEHLNFQPQQVPEAYILGIAKKLWMKKFKYEINSVSLEGFESEIVIPTNFYPSVNTNRLLTLLETTGKKCLELLHAFYYEHLSMRDIQKQLGFSSEHSTTSQKYKCIEKIRDTLQHKSISYESFFE